MSLRWRHGTAPATHILLHLLVRLCRGDGHDVDRNEGARRRDRGEMGNHKPAGFARSKTGVPGVLVKLKFMSSFGVEHQGSTVWRRGCKGTVFAAVFTVIALV